MTNSTATNEDGNERRDVWNRVLRTALQMPGAQIDRTSFLKKALSLHFPEDIVQKAIDSRPALAGIPPTAIQSIAQSSIKWHRAGVSGVSFLTGLPSGWWIAGAIPADMTQFFWHVTVILQKLTYLYGWPSFFEKDQELDDETLLVFTIFVGVMFGAGVAGRILVNLSDCVAKQVIVRLPRKALTRWGFYNIARLVAKWIGIRLTKQSFARALSRVIPVLGGFISGLVTWLSFSTMSKRLCKHLESTRLHQDSA